MPGRRRGGPTGGGAGPPADLPAPAGLSALPDLLAHPGAALLLAPALLLLAIAAAAVALLAMQRRRWRAGAAMALLALAGTALAVLEAGDGLAPPLPPAPPPPAQGVRGQILAGPVTHVRDGDTIVVGQTPIRFTDVDCPENGTPEGERATQALRQMVAGQQVECRLEGRRSYDREIGICSLGGRNLGLALVAQGLCLRR